MSLYLQSLLLSACASMLTLASLWLLSGMLGQFSLCHGSLVAAGAYGSALFSLYAYPGGSSFFCTFFLFLSVAVGGFFGGLAGFMAGLPTVRLSKEHVTVATLAFGEIFRAVLLGVPFLGGKGLSRGEAGQSLVGIPRIAGGGFALMLTLLCLFLMLLLSYGSFGRSCHAVRDDEAAAMSIGLSPGRIKILCFTLSGIFAGVAGALFAHSLGTLSPVSFSFIRSTEYAMLTSLSGNSLPAAILLGLLSVLLPELLSPFSKHRMLLYTVFILLALRIRAKKELKK